MELFVINRHGDEKSGVTEEEEQLKLHSVLQRIQRKRKRSEKPEKPGDEHEDKGLEDVSNENHEQPSEAVENIDEKPITETAVNAPKSKQPKLLNLEGFTILGVDNINKKAQTRRVLPQWLAHPTVISSNLQDLQVKVSKMKQLDLSIRRQLKENGIRYFFPVQAHVIPCLLEMHQHSDVMFPRDICVSAPTGSGKTLAFTLPIIQALKHYTVRKIRALVILPTQDLAEQVFKTFKTYTKGSNTEVGLITGKHLFDIEQKQLVYHNEAFGYVSKIDILVCTAGRLVSHMKQTKGFNLQSLEFLVIDEADRVLDSIQDDWLYHLQKHSSDEDFTVHSKKVLNLLSLETQRSPQKLLFSATLTQDPEKIEKLSLFQPKLFTSVTEAVGESEDNAGRFMGKYTTPDELTEQYIACSKDLKPLVLYAFIQREKLTKTIVFTHSVDTANRLKILLESLFSKSTVTVDTISSKLKGTSREKLIQRFSAGDLDILISTDSLARGIDLPGVRCVVSYSAPKYLKTYIHRAGRTARAGESGLAVTLLHHEQLPVFKSLTSQLKKNVERLDFDEEDLQPMSELYKTSLQQLKAAVEKEEKTEKRNIILTKKSMQLGREGKVNANNK